MLKIVTFLGMEESKTDTCKIAVGETMDDSILDNDDEEMSMSTSTTALTSQPSIPVPAATSKESAGEGPSSVSSLSRSFMASVTVGSNEVFSAPKLHANDTTQPTPPKKPDPLEPGGGDSQGSMRWSARRVGTGSLLRHYLALAPCQEMC